MKDKKNSAHVPPPDIRAAMALFRPLAEMQPTLWLWHAPSFLQAWHSCLRPDWMIWIVASAHLKTSLVLSPVISYARKCLAILPDHLRADCTQALTVTNDLVLSGSVTSKLNTGWLNEVWAETRKELGEDDIVSCAIGAVTSLCYAIPWRYERKGSHEAGLYFVLATHQAVVQAMRAMPNETSACVEEIRSTIPFGVIAASVLRTAVIAAKSADQQVTP